MRLHTFFIVTYSTLLSASHAAVFIIDSFTAGEAITLVDDGAIITPNWGPVGSIRSMGAGGRLTAGSSTCFTNSPDDGAISYYGEGYRTNNSPVSAIISYNGGGPYSLSNFSALTFNFSEVIGSGLLIINWVGTGTGPLKIPVTEASLITVAFSEWLTPTNNQLPNEIFNGINIEWKNISYASGFTLREIAAIQTAIPEPANYAALTTLVALSACMLRRSRRHLR